MKHFLILLLIVLFSNINAQRTFEFYNNYGIWQSSSNASCGMGNVFCGITKGLDVNGQLNYQIYFSSNSFFPNCTQARTYIENIEIFTYDEYIGTWIYPQGFSVFWMTTGQSTLAYTIYSQNPSLRIKIKVGRLLPTLY